MKKKKAPAGAKAKVETDNTNKINGGANQAQAFLEQLRPRGPWVLTAIAPDGQAPIVTITATTAAQAADWVQQHRATRNLYYAVNPARGPTNKKLEKIDVAAIEFVLGDLDPKADETSEQAKARYLAELETFEPRATAVIDSGNGLNVLWRLNAAIPIIPPVRNDKGKLAFTAEDQAKINDVEARAKSVMERLGSVAGTQNIDRILRLPGTINFPTPAKRKKGYVECATKLIWFNGATCSLDDFPLPEKKQKQKAKAVKKELPRELRLMLQLQGTGEYETRSHLLWAFLLEALRKGIDESVIVAATLDPSYQSNAIFEHVQEKGGEDYVKRQIEKAVNEIPTTDENGRTIIVVKEGELDKAWRTTQQALIDHGCPVYVRANRLVQPLWRWEKAEGSNVLATTFATLNGPRLADITAHHAVQFQKFDKQQKQNKNIDPPSMLINQIIEVKHWLFPTVVGIINAPTMRIDGSLLTEQGYDPQTQLWYKSSGDVVLPPIAEKPTKRDAEKALEVLDELLVGFPFENDTAHTVALAGIMTAVLRGALPAVPLFAIVATEPRTGKTFLIHLIAYIATGHVPTPTAGALKPEEMEKRIETAALGGRPIMHLNNLPNGMVIESQALAQISTEGWVNIRKLGKHEEGLCDCRATTVFLNGNNILMAADLVPRTLLARLNANMEEPERQTFQFDPIDKVRADRGKYLAAVFTIARAFLAAGCPKQPGMHSVAGFGPWSRLVQQPLMWLGRADPFGNMEMMRAMDPTLEELDRLINVLKKYVTDVVFTVADCRKLAEEQMSDVHGRPHYLRPDLRELMTDRGSINPEAFGWMLKRHRGRVRGGWAIKAMPTKVRGSAAYKLKSSSDPQPAPVPPQPAPAEPQPAPVQPKEEPF